jgi:hypothetical protein
MKKIIGLISILFVTSIGAIPINKGAPAERRKAAYEACKRRCEERVKRLNAEDNLGFEQTEGEYYQRCVINECYPILYAPENEEVPNP